MHIALHLVPESPWEPATLREEKQEKCLKFPDDVKHGAVGKSSQSWRRAKNLSGGWGEGGGLWGGREALSKAGLGMEAGEKSAVGGPSGLWSRNTLLVTPEREMGWLKSAITQGDLGQQI